jgi:hypothetical protein
MAAMTGALVGAFAGSAAIPPGFLEKLEDGPPKGRDYINALLLAKATDPQDWISAVYGFRREGAAFRRRSLGAPLEGAVVEDDRALCRAAPLRGGVIGRQGAGGYDGGASDHYGR